MTLLKILHITCQYFLQFFRLLSTTPQKKLFVLGRQSISRSNSGHPRIISIFFLINHQPLIKKGGNSNGQYLQNTAIELRLHMIPGIFPLVQQLNQRGPNLLPFGSFPKLINLPQTILTTLEVYDMKFFILKFFWLFRSFLVV